MDWRTYITSEMSESYTTFYVEAIDACPITAIKPFILDGSGQSVQYFEWLTDNMNDVTTIYHDNSELYQIFWDDFQELDAFEAQCQNTDEEYYFTITQDSDYISDVYE